MLRAAFITALILVVSLTAAGQQLRLESFEGHDVASGEVLVRFRNSNGPQAMALAAQDTDIVSSEPVGRAGVVRLRSRGRSVGALLRAYRQRFDVLYAEPNYILRATEFPNDEFAPKQWALKNTGQEIEGQAGTAGADIGLESAWNIAQGSRSIVVGIVDSGIDYNHPDLAGNIWSAPAAFTVTIAGQVISCAAGTHGFNAVKKNCDPVDEDGHGTHVAGIVGAAGNNGLGVSGVSPISSLMALKFIGTGGFGTTADAVMALDFAVQVKAIFPDTANIRVLNNSWGNGNFSQALLDEVHLANLSDILFVVSSGNDGANNDLTPSYPGNLAVANIVSVAATDNRDALADFSNWGPTSVHLGAPGVAILSTAPQGPFEFESGTSMAAPMVAGSAALLLSACPLTTPALKALLLANVDPVASLAGRTVAGGRLNVFRALSACAASTSDFSLTVSPGTRQLELMQQATFEVTVTGRNGFNEPVDLSLVNAPAGMEATLSSTSVFDGSGSSTLTLIADNTVEAGTYLIGVRGISGSIEHSSGVAVTVGFPIVPGETISGELTAHDAPSPEAADKYGDLFRLTLLSTTAVTVDLKSRGFDTLLYLRSSSGDTLFSDNDSGTHNNSRIQATLAPGTYSIEVTSFELSEVGRYTLSINTPTLTDVLPYIGEAGSTLTAVLTGDRFSPEMTVDAGSGIDLVSMNVVDSTLASVALTIASDVVPGPRDLTVRTSDGKSNPLTLTIPTVINLGQRMSGFLSSTDQILVNRRPYRYADIYQLRLTAATSVTIDLISDDIDAYLYLVSGSGDVLSEDDDSGFIVDARITKTLAAGTYFIEATSSDKLGVGSYSISVNAPTLESISPSFLALGSTNTPVTLHGTRFAGLATIDAGSGITVSNVSVPNSTTITARFTVSGSATPGLRDIRVTTFEGTSNSIKFRVVPAIPGISAGGRISGTLSETDPESLVIPGSHADLYSIPTTSSDLSIELVTNGFEGHLTLLSSSGDILAESEDVDGSGATLISGAFPSAAYIEVSSRNPRASGTYALGYRTILITSMTPVIGIQSTEEDLFFSGRFFTIPLSIDPGPGITVTSLSFTPAGGGVINGSAHLTISAGATPGLRKIRFIASNGSDYYFFFVLPTLPVVTQGQSILGALSGGDLTSVTREGTYGDYFKVTLVGSSGVVEVSSSEFKVSLSEISANGDVLGQSEGFTARLNLSAGTHIIEVTSEAPTVGAYTLVVPSPPTLNSITPDVGAKGGTFGVVLTGTNFSAPMSMTATSGGVTFSNFNVYSPTLATAVATVSPSTSLGGRSVAASTSAGISNSLTFTVVASTPTFTPASKLSFVRFFAPADLGGTGIAVVNPGAVAADVQFSMYTLSGTLVGFYTETIGPRSQMSRLGSLLFPGAAQTGWIEVASATPGLQGFWLGGDFTNVTDGAESAPKAHELIFPLVTPTTEINVVSTTTGSVTVRVHDGNGSEMGSPVLVLVPANGGVQFGVGSTFPDVDLNNASYIRVTSAVDIMGTSVTSDYPVGPSWVVLNGVDSSTLSTEVNFPHVPTGGEPEWLTIAGITNLSTNSQTVTFTFTPNSGSPVSVIRQITGRGSIRESVDDLFSFGGASRNGWIRVTGTKPLTGYIVYGYTLTGGAAALPVQTAPLTSMIFSHVATGPLFGTGVALLNTTARDANVELYIMRRTGALVGGAADVATAAFQVKAGKKEALLLDALVPASTNDDGFVFVRSTNGVPLYAFELFFTRDSKVIANVPAGILTPDISYTPPEPSSPLPPVTISSLSPATAPAGMVITINGAGFDLIAADNTVVFNTATASVSVPAIAATLSTLTVAVPANAVTGPVFFKANGRFSNSVTLTVP